MEHTLKVSEREATTSAWVRRTLSVMFGGLFLFEFLNYLKVFQYQVDYTWFGRFFSTLVLFGILRVIDEVFKRTLKRRLQGTVWFVMAGLLWLDFCGDIFHFYSRWGWYDQFVHFMSGICLVVCLILVFETCVVRLRWKLPSGIIFILALGINTIFAVAYELEEYLEDYFFHTQRLGDGFDTANDLMLNLLAGALTILGVVVWRKFSKPTLRALTSESP